MKANTHRYPLPDFLRGLALLNMIAYHTLADCVLVFSMDIPMYSTELVHIWQRGIACMFVLLAGFSASLGRRPYRRAIILTLCGGAITSLSLILMPENRVVFGVLTFLGAAELLWALLRKGPIKISPAVGLVASMLLFMFTLTVPQGALGIGELTLIKLPVSLYRNLFTAFLGFRPVEFYSMDYFPMIPWFFLFLAGFFIYRRLEETEMLPLLERGHCPFLCSLGRRSLLIYLLHQPILLGILYLIAR